MPVRGKSVRKRREGRRRRRPRLRRPEMRVRVMETKIKGGESSEMVKISISGTAYILIISLYGR